MTRKKSYHSHGWKKNKRHRRGMGSKLRLLPTLKKLLKKLPKNFTKNAILILIALFILGSLGILGLFAYLSRDLPDPNSLTDRTINQTTKIYDRTGEHLLYEIFGDENRTLSKLQEGFCTNDDSLDFDDAGIPLHAIEATIAAEDANFCQHHGFSVKGILRAVIFRGSRGGGSTLTQQLVKNAILSPERTITRKIKELIISVELERRYSKDEILQIYFNEIAYGSTYYGLQSAATNYFDKPASDLSIAEAAALAAMPKSPTTYLNNPDLLRERRDWIIGRMLEFEYITQEEADSALQEETVLSVNITNIDAPHFVFYIKEQLEEQYGQRQVETGGLKVITTLDYDMQKIAEEEVKRGIDERGERYDFENAALVAIDPKTGQVLAMVGSRDFFDEEIDGQVNVATRLRQPGSSFKPIVYAKAFDLGYTPNSVLWDVKTTFPTVTGGYSPNNYDLGERGPVRLRQALQNSLNIPAVKVLYLVGVEKALTFAEDLGYTSFSDRSNFGLAIVLGGAEVKLIEHVSAYATFANEGLRHENVSIMRVEDASGNILDEWKEDAGKQVVDENVARTITNVLSDNDARAGTFGTNSSLKLSGRPAAAKTGTTNDYRDGWTVGFTPSLAAGVWTGNNDNSEMKRGAGGSTVAAPIWNAFMTRALEETPVESFKQPALEQTGKAVLDGLLNTTTAIVDIASGKLATEYTPETMQEERTFAQYHSILHYVKLSNPLGDSPDPPSDPSYEAWETGIQDWIVRQEEETGIIITQDEVPTEDDDVHLPENFPSVSIESPSDNDEIETRDITIGVNASAPRGVTRVEFYLDGFFLGSDTSQPFLLRPTIPNTITRGYHTLKVLAYDDVENSGSATIGIQIESDPAASGLELIDPKNGQRIEKIGESYQAVVSLDDPAGISSVTLYQEQIGVGGRLLVETRHEPSSPFVTMTWPLPDSGQWVLSASAQTTDGNVIETAGILVTVVEPGETAEEIPEEGAPEEEPTAEEEPIELPELNPFLQPTEETQ